MRHAALLAIIAILLGTSLPAWAGDDHKYPPFSREAEIESRSWSVGGYTQHTYKGRDSRGNRISGTIEELPSGTVKFKSRVQRSPVRERVQRFLEQRQQR